MIWVHHAKSEIFFRALPHERSVQTVSIKRALGRVLINRIL